GIDFRSAGGMVVAPPSLLRRKICKPPFRYHFPGCSEDVLTADGVSWQCHFSLPDFSTIGPFPEALAKVVEAKEFEDRVISSSTTITSKGVKQSLKACLNYVAKIAGASKGVRNDETLKVCRALAGRFRNLGFEDQLTALRAWNDKNSPPLDDRDLRRKLRSTIHRRDKDEALGRDWAKPKPFYGKRYSEVIPDRYSLPDGTEDDAETFLEERVPADPSNLDLASLYLTKRFVSLSPEARLSVLEMWADAFEYPPDASVLERSLEMASQTPDWESKDTAVRERIANYPKGLLGIRKLVPKLTVEFPSLTSDEKGRIIKEHLNHE
ncbi:MAG: hypothetical protein KC964_02045, partial [Candidatus Omnitrophica bacterium]|nr:hypothetical protein [Candidatus Omnitrophota bacterium]